MRRAASRLATARRWTAEPHAVEQGQNRVRPLTDGAAGGRFHERAAGRDCGCGQDKRCTSARPCGSARIPGRCPCLAVAVDGSFEVHMDASSGPPVRSALIPPRLRRQLVADADLMAFCYFDPASVWHNSCRRAMTATGGTVDHGHRHEQALAATAEDLTDVGPVRAWLDLAAGPPPAGGCAAGTSSRSSEQEPAYPGDPRIRGAVDALRRLGPHETCSAADLAAAAGLSTSRFLHLFREHVRTSFRRYRTWLRMLRAVELIRGDVDLTTAAVEAGFASPSHFSTSFHAMFGVRPRQLLGTEIRLA